MPITAECGSCGQRFNVNDSMADRRLKCPHCKGVIQVPLAATAVDGRGDLCQPAVDEPQPEAARQCPSCGAAMQENAVLCVQCGYDSRTGAKITTGLSGSTAAPPHGPTARQPEEQRFDLPDDVEVEGPEELAACFRTVCSEAKHPSEPQSPVERPFYALSVGPGRVALFTHLKAVRAYLCEHALSPRILCRYIDERSKSEKLDPKWLQRFRERPLAALFKAEYGERASYELREWRGFQHMDYVDSLQPYLRDAYLASLHRPRLGWAAVRGIVWGNTMGSILNIFLMVLTLGFCQENRFPINLIVAVLWGGGFAVGYPIGALLGALSGGDGGVANPDDWQGVGPDSNSLAKILVLPFIGALVFATLALIAALVVGAMTGTLH